MVFGKRLSIGTVGEQADNMWKPPAGLPHIKTVMGIAAWECVRL